MAVSAIMGLHLIVTVPVEEIFKVLGLIYLVLKHPESLQDKKSGAILGGIGGLTFGIIEMLISGSGLLGLIFSTPLHVMCSGLAGIGLVFAATKKQEQSKSDYSVIFGNETLTFWLIAIALHFIYNFLAFSLKEAGVLLGLAAALFVFYKLYKYLPTDFNNMPVTGPAKLLSDAFSSSPIKTDEQTKKATDSEKQARKHAFCTKCGTKLEEEQRFCSKCGEKI